MNLNNSILRAIHNEDLDEVKRLVKSGVSVNGKECCNLSILGYSICSSIKSKDVYKYLVSVGAVLNQNENLIKHIISYYHFYTIDTLALAIEAGADVNMLDCDGNSPLMLARDIPDTRFRKPLDHIVIYNSVEVIDFLKIHGAV